MNPAEAPALPIPRKTPAAFRRLLASNAFESIADNSVRTLLPVIAVSALGAGTAQIGVLNALGLGAFLAFGLPIGGLVDRLPKLGVMRAADLVRAVAVLAVPVLFLLDALVLWQVLLAAALLGITDVFFTSASGAWLPTVVGTEELGIAYARLQRVSTLASVGSPAVATTLLKVLAAPLVLALAGIGYLLSALLLPRFAGPEPASDSDQRPRFWSSIAQGVSLAVHHPVMRALLLSNMLLNASVMLGNSVLAVYVISSLGYSAAAFAMIGTLSALGGLAASIIAPRLLGRWGIGRLKIAASLGCVPAVGVLALAQHLPGPALGWVAVQSLIWSFMLVLATVAGAGVIPQLCAPTLLATVMAAHRFFTLGVMPVASLVGGLAAVHLGITPILWTWAVLAGFSALPILLSPLRSWHLGPEPRGANL